MIAGVIAFLLVDVVLVVFAISLNRSSGAAPEPETLPTVGVEASSTPTPTAPPVVPAPRFLVATSPTSAWRSSPGECGGADAVLESTTDGGATWAPHSTGDDAVHEVLALAPIDQTQVSVVGKAGDGCTTTSVFSSFTSGDFWQSYPETLSSYSYVDPADRATLIVTGSAQATPCSPALQAVATTDRVLAVCAGQVAEFIPSAQTWSTTDVPGVLAVTPTDTGSTVAVSGAEGCAGIAIEALPSPLGGAPATVLGCVADETSPLAATLSQSGSTLWLWSGGTTRISQDGGVTW
ncbi:hypothetical protein [Compostimonas suwonensis]|uniref:hypothetical protein n=1 Tax=Compostimonas suwonensis TaxID=1048394 RepID=UPI000C23B6B6|nr:hypothetical protein [Compostimonas suwonensis]